MRFVIYGIFLTLWMGMWLWTYTCHIKGTCCTTDSPRTEAEMVMVVKDDRPVLFNWEEHVPVTGSGFVFYRDSIIALLDDDQILEITGRYDMDEVAPAGHRDMGLARAAEVLTIMAPQLDTSRFRLKSVLFNEKIRQRNIPFAAVDIRLLTFNQSIQEVDDKVLIYFPFNSTSMVSNPAIDAYIDKLVSYLNENEDNVIFTGHSDAFGPSDSNYELGLWRATAMRDLLIEKGIDPNRIEVKSKGETEPIATNRTPAGARRNRRVELQLVKQ